MNFHDIHLSLPITQILWPRYHTIAAANVRFFITGRQNDTLGIVLCLDADSAKRSCSDAAGNADSSHVIGLDSDIPPGTTLNGTLSNEVDRTDTSGDMLGIFGWAGYVLIMYKKGSHRDISGRAEDAAVEFSMVVDILGDDK